LSIKDRVVLGFRNPLNIVPNPSPQIHILHTNREPKVIAYQVTTAIKSGTIVLPKPRPDSCRAKQFYPKIPNHSTLQVTKE
jgi:hypothetical protein